MASWQTVVLLVVSSVLIEKCLAERVPTISYITPTLMKDIGGTIDLTCAVEHAADYPVIWRKIDPISNTNSLFISTGNSLLQRKSKYSLRHDNTNSTYTLQIKNVQETDAGFYGCQIVVSLSNKVSAEVELQVRRPPFIFDNSTKSVLVSEGEAVELECYADGYPSPIVSWRRENNAVLPTGGSIYKDNILKIKTITYKDRGTYYCVAQNGVGRKAKRKIDVTVIFTPVVTVSHPRVGQLLQYNVSLECQVEAYPLPAMTWVKDGIALHNNQHYRISKFGRTDEVRDMILNIITIEKRQYGQYICQAINKVGAAEGVVELFDSTTLGCPPACDEANGKNATTVTITTATSLDITTAELSTSDE